MTVELTVVISVATAIIGAALGIIGANRSAKKDAEAEGKSDGIVLTELGYIKSSVDDIKSEQRKTAEGHTSLLIEVTGLKRDLKTAWTRIDELKQTVTDYHKGA